MTTSDQSYTELIEQIARIRRDIEEADRAFRIVKVRMELAIEHLDAGRYDLLRELLESMRGPRQ